MKGSCTLMASVLAAAASTVAFTSSSGHRDFTFYHCSNEASSSSSSTYSTSRKGEVEVDVSRAHSSMSDKEKFAPRFDGLRFIETLVTAHR